MAVDTCSQEQKKSHHTTPTGAAGPQSVYGTLSKSRLGREELQT